MKAALCEGAGHGSIVAAFAAWIHSSDLFALGLSTTVALREGWLEKADLSRSTHSVKIDNMPKLIVAGTTYELVEDLITIGRASDNTVVINDPSVSSRHAQLQRTGETYRIKDLGSTNGTRVNGIPVSDATLRFDDRIRFGATDARYEADTAGSQPLPQLEEVEAAPARLSAVPADFANASPFLGQKRQKDPVRTAIIAGAGLALLVFFGSMVAVLLMHAPGL